MQNLKRPTADTSARLFPPLTSEEEAQLMRELPNSSTRLLIRVLLDHDEGNELGAYPSHETISRLTGWSPKSVRNRIAELRKAGLLKSRRGGAGRLMCYYVTPPVASPTGVAPQTVASRWRPNGVPMTPPTAGHSIEGDSKELHMGEPPQTRQPLLKDVTLGNLPRGDRGAVFRLQVEETA
jgi:hypothetical protein